MALVGLVLNDCGQTAFAECLEAPPELLGRAKAYRGPAAGLPQKRRLKIPRRAVVVGETQA